MSLADRILTGLRTVVIMEERLTNLAETVRSLKSLTEAKFIDHDRRLIRLETIIDLTRPDGTTLRIAPP